MTLKQALWEIVRDENIIITNQNIDWLLDRALKKASGDAQTLKESILERKEILDEKFPTNENKSNNLDVKSNEELFKQALVEGLNRRFDKTIEEAKKIEKIEQIEEIAKVLDDCCNRYDEYGNHLGNKCSQCEEWDDTNNLCCSYNTKQATALYNAGYRKQEWISVEDRLPEIDDEVLVYYSNSNIAVAKYIRVDGLEFWFETANCFRNITHWMPLPEAPKMTRKEDEGK